MSYNRKRVPPSKRRGPSRPIDPRRVPGQTRRQGPDRFGVALISITGGLVLLLLAWIALTQNTGSATTTTIPAKSSDPAAQATQAEVDFLTRSASLPKISPQDAIKLVGTPGTQFIDVRATAQYDGQHIKGATNIPYTDASKRISEFPKQGTLILYCQWPHDEESAGVALTLVADRYTNVKVLQGGIDAWKAAGGPTEP